MTIEISEYSKLARDNHKLWEGLGIPEKVHASQDQAGTKTFPATENPLVRIYVSANCTVQLGAGSPVEFWPAGTLEVRQIGMNKVITVVTP